jgi:hypothetical protein
MERLDVFRRHRVWTGLPGILVAALVAACGGSGGPAVGDAVLDVLHTDEGNVGDFDAAAPDTGITETDPGADLGESDAGHDPSDGVDASPDVPECLNDEACVPLLPDLGKCELARCIQGKCVKAAAGCHAPGPPACADDTHIETFLDPGICDPATGLCSYPSVLTPCPDGCAEGVCPGLKRLVEGGFTPAGTVGLDDSVGQGACVMPGWAAGSMKSDTYSAVAGFEP